MKLYANTEMLNCKQVTKFQQNWSTSTTATASLVRSLKSTSVHYRHRRDWLSSVRLCEWQDVSTPKVCVQNVHCVLKVKRKLEDVDSTAWPLYWWPPGGNVPTLRSGATSAGRRHVAAVHTILQPTLNLVVDWVKVRTVCWPQTGMMKSGVSWVNRCTVSCALWAGRLFCSQYLNINNSCNK